MHDSFPQLPAPDAVLLFAEIKRIVAAFDEGETNVFEALQAITFLLRHYNQRSQTRAAA